MSTAILAWNNLLGFPYLYGYTGHTLDRLMGEYGMQRLRVYPDTLMPIAGPHHARWAVIEEGLSKGLCRALTLPGQVAGKGQLRFSPWNDHYYRLC